MASRKRGGRAALAAVGSTLVALGALQSVSSAPLRPIDHAPGDIVVAGRGLISLSPDGRFRRTIDPPPFSPSVVAVGRGGMIFSAGELPTLRRYEPDAPAGQSFANFTDGSKVTAMATTADGDIYVGTSDGQFLHAIHRFTPIGVSPLPFLLTSAVRTLDVAADGCTVLYGTAAPGLRRLDFCSRTRLQAVPVPVPARAVRLLRDTTVLVAPAGGGPIRRVGADGRTVRTYGARGVGSWTAMDVTPDGNSLWAASGGGALFRFDLASGAQQQGPIGLGIIRGLAVAGAPRGSAPESSGLPEREAIDLDGISTLTGEAVTSLANPPQQPRFQCSPGGETSVKFDGAGEAIGPYPGSFAVDLAATIGRQSVQLPSGVLGIDVGPLRALQGDFTIRSAERIVTGRVSLPAAGLPNTGTCIVFERRTFPRSFVFPPNYALTGYYSNAHARPARYEARIFAAGRVFVDRGATTIFTEEYHLLGVSDQRFAGGLKRHVQTFVSDRVSVTDSFRASSQRVRHSAGFPRTTRKATLQISWRRPRDQFVVAGLRLSARRAYESGRQERSGKLKITTVRSPTKLKITVSGLQGGRLRFDVVARRVAGATPVETAVLGRSG
ncbi:MAG: hypothetical protein H0T39_05535 [Actinobacteria bacterium]|nr:hypothetical protein [Actinomycetota bacterium]